MRLSYARPVLIFVAVFIALGLLLYFVFRNNSEEALEVTPAEESVSIGPVQKNLGLSVDGRKIESYTFGTGERHILFVGGIHGGYEWNSVVLAYEILDYLKANPATIPQNIKVTIIPVLNPDGLYRVTKKEGRFSATDVSKNTQVLASGRFNANEVDLNRNFDCKWKPESLWREKVVSAGSAPFSEPESLVLKNFVLENKPDSVIFWHSQASAVYASKCEGDVLPDTLQIMNIYASASGYSPVKTFSGYETTGDSEGWLASIGIPAVTVELKTHETVEFEKNLVGVKSIIEYYSKK